MFQDEPCKQNEKKLRKPMQRRCGIDDSEAGATFQYDLFNSIATLNTFKNN